MGFNVYDMLVFEDENGNIYQDCVIEIDHSLVETDYTDAGNDYYYTDIICNNLALTLDECGGIVGILPCSDIWYDKKLTLKEIWSREDEDTYKKVWSRE